MPTYLLPITLALLLSLPLFWRLEQDLQSSTAAYFSAALPDNSFLSGKAD